MKKIAIIDDEQDILITLKKFLNKSNNFAIETFTNPLNAIPKIKDGEYDLVISDIMMPQMNGLDLLKDIKKILPNQKFIMITAFSTEEKMMLTEKLDVNYYIPKPFVSLRYVEKKVLETLGL